MKLIPLYNRFDEVVAYAKVDDEDYTWLSQWRWNYDGKYASRSYRQNGENCKDRMHRLVSEAKAGEAIDHRNGDQLDNRKNNLRRATKAENNRNRTKSTLNTSGYKGVTLHKSGRWKAQIGAAGRNRHLGLFDEIEEAARAYDEAALQLHGNFARLNFPKEN